MPAQRGGREVRNARRARARERSPRELCRLHPFIVTKPRAAAAVPLAVEDPPTGTKACFLRVRGIQVARLPLSPGAEVEASSWIASPAPSLHLRTGGGRDRPICKFGKTAAFTPRCTYLAGFSSGAKKHQETRGGGSEPPLLLPPAGRAASSVRALAQVARRVATRSPGHLCARALLRTAAAVARPAALTDWRNGGNEGVRSADSHPSVLVARQSSDWRGMSPVVARHRTGEHRSL